MAEEFGTYEKKKFAPPKVLEQVKNQKKFVLKTAKGTCDYKPTELAIKEKLFKKIISCFKQHGAVAIDTPVFEIKKVLTGKYGEDSEFLCDLANQGGEIISLRYDLTVPFARYLAMNKISHFKKYQIGKVYRRGDPSMAKGQYREFYQCDFDNAGQYDEMIPDVECVRVMKEILTDLDIGDFIIKVNHRKILEGIFEYCGAPSNKFHRICSSMSKFKKEFANIMVLNEELDETLNEVDETLNEELDVTVIYKINEFIKRGRTDLIDELLSNEALSKNKSAVDGLKSMKLFFSYCELYGVLDKVSFDLSFARGFDYYTGIMFGVFLKDQERKISLLEQEVTCRLRHFKKLAAIESIAGGGRYDELVGIFDSKHRNVPCVGMSIEIDKIYSLMKSKSKASDKINRRTEIEVYVTTPQKKLAYHRMRLCRDLRDAGIKAGQSSRLNTKFLNELQYCEAQGISLAVILGESEIQRGVVKIRNVKTREENEIPEFELINFLKKRQSLDDNESG